MKRSLLCCPWTPCPLPAYWSMTGSGCSYLPNRMARAMPITIYVNTNFQKSGKRITDDQTCCRATCPGLPVQHIGRRIHCAQRHLAQGQPYAADLPAPFGLTALSRPCDAVGATSPRICSIEYPGVHRYVWPSLLGASLVAGDAITLSGLAGSDAGCLSPLWAGSFGSAFMEREDTALLCTGVDTWRKTD